MILSSVDDLDRRLASLERAIIDPVTETLFTSDYPSLRELKEEYLSVLQRGNSPHVITVTRVDREGPGSFCWMGGPWIYEGSPEWDRINDEIEELKQIR